VTVTHDGQVYVPTVQLDAALSVNDRVAELVRRSTEHGMDGWATWYWFETPNTWLDGDAPARRIRAGDVDAARHALDGMFQE
jgi:hypothetical protein